MNAVIKFFRKSVQPGSARIGTRGVEVVEKNVGGDRRRVFKGTGAGTKLPFSGFDVFFER